jgi:hypothetical protein
MILQKNQTISILEGKLIRATEQNKSLLNALDASESKSGNTDELAKQLKQSLDDLEENYSQENLKANTLEQSNK